MTATFKNKVVLVTGGASGIGRTTARRFAAEGAKVCVADIDLAGAEQTVQLIRGAGGEAVACRADVASEADNEHMVQCAIDNFGGLDIAFLNAAYLTPLASFFDSKTEDFDRIIAINLRGCYLGLKSVGRAIRSGGAVVVTSSAAGLTGWPDNAAYSASKHGVIGLVRSAAEAYAKRGVRVNVVCPGTVNTGMTPDVIRRGVADEMVDPDQLPMAPFKGLASTQHVAEVVLLLASPRAAFLNASVFNADAGLLSSFPGTQ